MTRAQTPAAPASGVATPDPAHFTGNVFTYIVTAPAPTMTATTAKVRTYGFRTARTGEVFAFTEAPTRGRCRPSKELLVGHVWKLPAGWRHDAASDIYPTQSDAAVALVRIICR